MKQYKVMDSQNNYIGDFKSNGKIYGTVNNDSDTRVLYILLSIINIPIKKKKERYKTMETITFDSTSQQWLIQNDHTEIHVSNEVYQQMKNKIIHPNVYDFDTVIGWVSYVYDNGMPHRGLKIIFKG